MNVYGNTCPMCCGDLDDVVYLRTGAAVCLSCGCNAEAPTSTPSTARRPEAIASSVSGYHYERSRYGTSTVRLGNVR